MRVSTPSSIRPQGAFVEPMMTDATTLEGHAVRLEFLAAVHLTHPEGSVFAIAPELFYRDDVDFADVIAEQLTSTAALLRKLAAGKRRLNALCC